MVCIGPHAPGPEVLGNSPMEQNLLVSFISLERCQSAPAERILPIESRDGPIPNAFESPSLSFSVPFFFLYASCNRKMPCWLQRKGQNYQSRAFIFVLLRSTCRQQAYRNLPHKITGLDGQVFSTCYDAGGTISSHL